MCKILLLFFMAAAPGGATLIERCHECPVIPIGIWESQIGFLGAQVALACIVPLLLRQPGVNPYRLPVQLFALLVAGWLGFTLHGLLAVPDISWFVREQLPLLLLLQFLPLALLQLGAKLWDAKRVRSSATEIVPFG